MYADGNRREGREGKDNSSRRVLISSKQKRDEGSDGNKESTFLNHKCKRRAASFPIEPEVSKSLKKFQDKVFDPSNRRGEKVKKYSLESIPVSREPSKGQLNKARVFDASEVSR
jgi:hypothetical protein